MTISRNLFQKIHALLCMYLLFYTLIIVISEHSHCTR